MLEIIRNRRSVRQFTSDPVTQEQVEKLLEAGIMAPSAMNKQPWHFAFVKDAGLLKEFNALAREHMLKNGPAPLRPRFEDPNYELLMGAPLFVILSTDPTGDGPFTGVDCGIAVENLPCPPREWAWAASSWACPWKSWKPIAAKI